MRVIRRIEPKKKNPNARKRVAAYARVSRDSNRLLHSLSAQISYYSEFIQKNPAWEYVGVYADEAITGTIMERRAGFQRLLRDCDDGKIDIVLVKSVSRFARNTVDLLETVRHLKLKGIDIWFEKEHIKTLSEDGELMLTILASFAQEEVRSVSENIKWSFKKKMEAGKAAVPVRMMGFEWDEGELVIIPEEAKVVRRIFEEYLSGKSAKRVAKSLNADGIRSIHGKSFNGYMVLYILRNVAYKGDLMLQKYYSVDPLTKELRKNNGERPRYYVESDHEPIIDEATFEAVQAEIDRRVAAIRTDHSEYYGMCTFTNKVKCPLGVRFFRHDNGGTFDCNGAWRCIDKSCPSREKCDCMGAPDIAIQQACKRALGLQEYDEEFVKSSVKQILILSYGTLSVELNDGRIYEDYYRDRNNLISFVPSKDSVFQNKLICSCGKPFTMIQRKYKSGYTRFWHCPDHDNSGIHENILRHRIAETSGWEEFDAGRFRAEIDYIEMDRPLHMMIHFNDCTEKPVDYYAFDNRRQVWKEK